MWKICTKCKKHKALWEFHKCSHTLFGVHSHCKACKSIIDKKYREENKDKISIQRHKFRGENKDRIRIQKATFHKNNKDKINKTKKEYRKNNKELITKGKKKYRESNALFDTFKNKLTIDESPRCTKNDNSLEVKCKYCKQYFIPSNGEAWHRVMALNGIDTGENNLYCSEECKLKCPVYGSHTSIQQKSNRVRIPFFIYEEITNRNNGMCEMCGENPIEEIHHEKPASTHPHLQLDKENLWGFCIPCHYKIFHQLEGCTLPELRKKSVNNCSTTD